jgi:hypothetical protein
MGNTQQVQISNYGVMYSANNSANTYSPRIALMNAAGNYMGQLVFLPDAVPLPNDRLVNGLPELYYHSQDFKNVLDLLRNEKPMWLYYNLYSQPRME